MHSFVCPTVALLMFLFPEKMVQLIANFFYDSGTRFELSNVAKDS
jgi:hypothetical protein